VVFFSDELVLDGVVLVDSEEVVAAGAASGFLGAPSLSGFDSGFELLA
jgi:hypothetical protein